MQATRSTRRLNNSMPVRMLRTERIAIDGRSVRWYREGEIINLPEALATALIRDGIATNKLTPESSQELPLAHQPKVILKPSKKREYRS